MPFLSLGLHNDEPPASSDQKENGGFGRKPGNGNGAVTPASNSTESNARPESMQQGGGVSANAPRAPHFLITEDENGNGHSVVQHNYPDEFEADKFEDESDPHQAAEKLHAWMAGAVQSETAQPANGNGHAATPDAPPKPAPPANGNGRTWTPVSLQMQTPDENLMAHPFRMIFSASARFAASGAFSFTSPRISVSTVSGDTFSA